MSTMSLRTIVWIAIVILCICIGVVVYNANINRFFPQQSYRKQDSSSQTFAWSNIGSLPSNRSYRHTFRLTCGNRPCTITLHLMPNHQLFDEELQPRSQYCIIGTNRDDRTGIETELRSHLLRWISPTEVQCQLIEFLPSKSAYEPMTIGRWEITLHYDTTASPVSAVLSGQWSNADHDQHSTFHTSAWVSYYGVLHPRWSLGYTYPLTAPHFASIMQTIISPMTESLQSRESELSAMEAFSSSHGATQPTTQVHDTFSYDDCTVLYQSDTLLSIVRQEDVYAGGAHGYRATTTMIFYAEHGSQSVPKALSLLELFHPPHHPTTNHTTKNHANEQLIQTIDRYIIKELYRQQASHVVLGNTTSIADALRDTDCNVAILPAGIAIYLAPYTVGSFAEGTFRVVIPYTVLAPFIAPQSPLWSVMNNARNKN